MLPQVPARVGRPTKLTRELAHRIYEYLKAGASFQATCRAVGISKEVFRRWRRPCSNGSPEHEHGKACPHVIERLERRDGEPVPTSEFLTFVALVEQALGEHEAGLARLITARAMKDPRVAMKMLSCRYPESWGLRRDLTCPEDARIDVSDARERLLETVRQVRTRLGRSRSHYLT